MIAQIENAVLELLKSAGDNDVLGYKYRTLESYPEEFDTYLKEKHMLRAPAAWCVFLGFVSMTVGDDGESYGLARFALVLAAENLRNETATRHGDDTVPGSYQLGLDAVGLLAGTDLGLDIGRITPRRMALVARTPEMRKQHLSLIAFEFETSVPIGQIPTDGEPGSFETFHADWDVPAFGNVGPALPDEDNADASDQVALEGDPS